jgi:hypothetical protein
VLAINSQRHVLKAKLSKAVDFAYYVPVKLSKAVDLPRQRRGAQCT